jgi:murein DD-endopeptidase MepM/ murein hydrolase activator NlpD
LARLAIVLCAIALVAGAVLVSAQPAAGQDLGSRIAAVRAAQKGAQASMRQQDRIILTLSTQRKAASKQLKPLEKALNRASANLVVAKSVLQERRARLAEKEALWTGPNASPPGGDWQARLADIRKEIRVAEARKDNMAARQRAAERAVRAKKSQIASLKRQRNAAVSRREAAEASLSAYIAQMTDLARAKVAQQATVSLAEGGTYSWPTTGRIVQPYGCTGFKLNPPKGKCKHFHDGIDVVDAYGTPIRTVAAGVVAYSGWNPYDKEGRAYVVDVVHADGYVSRYGHLIPTDRVKAGDLVYTGQVIGKMGNTGKSTGTHLHFELLRGGKDVDPLAYLPAGVVQIDKTSTKAGAAAATATRSIRQASGKRAKTTTEQEWLPPARPFDYAEERKVATCAPPASDGKGAKSKRAQSKPATSGSPTGAVECQPSGLFATPSADRPPTIPLPYRGTEPAPG